MKVKNMLEGRVRREMGRGDEWETMGLQTRMGQMSRYSGYYLCFMFGGPGDQFNSQLC